MTVIYSARWVLPIAGPAIKDGAVAVDGSKIAGVGNAAEVKKRFPDAQVLDQGAAAVLPGLINAHSHLELTVMRGFLENEERDFFAWLRELTVARMTMTDEDLFVSASCGGVEAARAGITCVGDSSSAARQSMKALREIGLRGTVYQESFGPDPNLAKQNLATLREQIAELRSLETEMIHAGVSPHAPYTVSSPQLKLIAQLATDEKLPLMMHAAESEAERQFLMEGTGVFAEGLQRRGIEWRAPRTSTIEYLAQNGILATQPLLAHCVNVSAEDIETIKSANGGIAHCPKSNAKLCHGRAPFAKFLARGVNTGFGSDSVASNNNCDILEEARFATLSSRASKAPAADSITAEQALFAATLGGARALGVSHRIGSLVEGMEADLIAIGLEGSHQQPAGDPFDSIIFSSSGRDVKLTMVAGKEIYRDGAVALADERELFSRLRTIREKLDQSIQQ